MNEQNSLNNASKRNSSEMDMTPMVDVTFLLLIFFMVTASFVLQNAMNRPVTPQALPSPDQIDKKDEAQDVVEVNIAADNTYYIVLPEQEPIEAPSEQDARIALANIKTGIVPAKMLISAHEESFHGRVVTAMDIGTDMDLAIQVQITDVDF